MVGYTAGACVVCMRVYVCVRVCVCMCTLSFATEEAEA